MPASLFSWYGGRELAALGERRSVLRGEIELKRFNRLAELLESDAGAVAAALHFRKDPGGWLIVQLEYETTVHLLCQRCLAPLEHHVKDNVEMALLETAALEQAVPDRYEPVVLEDRLMPAMLIEDELIISLPIVPRHERPEECDPPSAGVVREERG